MSDALNIRYGKSRIETRQIDELVGLARGLVADGVVNQAEVEFLQKWLAANIGAIEQPFLYRLYKRVVDILSDGVVDASEKAELLETLSCFANSDFELGETLRATTLPLCTPAPKLSFSGKVYCFTGTFVFGERKACAKAASERGATVSKNVTRSVDVLVIGTYATDSWKHSAFGNKILYAVELRDTGIPISIVSEEHWVQHL